MIEAEPALLHLLGQRGESFVDRGPVTEMFQSGGLALLQGLLQMETAFVVHVVVEVNVHTGSRIVDEEPARLSQLKPLTVLIDNHGSDT